LTRDFGVRRRARANGAWRQAVSGHRRYRAIAGEHRVVTAVFSADRRAPAVALAAETQVVFPALAVVVIGLRAIDSKLAAVVVMARDDVDDAGDRIGTVDRRCAVEQHLDAVDHRDRNRTQVDRAADIGDEALAIEQHQGAVGAKAAQVWQHLAAAAVVDAPVQCFAVEDDVLNDVGNVRQAGTQDFGAVDREDGMLRLDVDATDVRAEHLDRSEYRRVGCSRRLISGCRKRQQQRGGGETAAGGTHESSAHRQQLPARVRA
jgi:hypothetical protein